MVNEATKGANDLNEALARLLTPPPLLPPMFVSADTFQREAILRRDRIFANHALFRDILDRHEAVIRRRWAKKDRKRRLDVLLVAWPNMPTSHRPDFAAVRAKHRDLALSPEPRGSFMWPYINREDLANPKSLPLLLNARGRHPPCAFAAADIKSMQLGIAVQALKTFIVPGYCVALNSITRQGDYGRVLVWENCVRIFGWDGAERRLLRQFQPWEGLLILEAQDRLLEFFVDCCHRILHDIPATDLTTNPTHPIQPEPEAFQEGDEATGPDSLAVLAEEAPYRVSGQLDLGRVAALLTAQARSVEDHAWAMREDPGYFAERLQQDPHYDLDWLADVKAKRDPALEPGGYNTRYKHVIHYLAHDAYLRPELFAWLACRARELHALQKKHAPAISPTEDLPEEFFAKLLSFRFLLDQILERYYRPAFFMSTRFLPTLARFWPRDPSDPPAKGPAEKPDAAAFQLIWHLGTLKAVHHVNGFLTSAPGCLDALGRLLQADAKTRELLSPLNFVLLSDLSVLEECHRQLDLYQPWARMFRGMMEIRKGALRREFEEQFHLMILLTHEMQGDLSFDRAVPLVRLLGNKFVYPIEKRRTRGNVAKLRQAEANLDAVWNWFDRLVRDQVGGLGSSVLGQFLARDRTLQRTPEWVEPAITTPVKNKSDQQGAGPTSPEDLLSPLSTLYFGSEPSPSRGGVRGPKTPPRIKVKTRGTPSKSYASDETSEQSDADGGNPRQYQQQQEQQQQANTYAVSARTLRVFRMLFFNPAATATPGEVPWGDFLHAMGEMGFAAQKLWGSAWHFHPAEPHEATEAAERSIQFHEPHPGGKIPFHVARRQGRRLNRAFGWHGAMFVLRKK